MGICSSCESTSVATAKLILQDGRLQEYSYPVKVAYVLAKYPSSFICNSDEMDFDDVLSAVNGDDELQMGQLYFALPVSKLKRPLQAKEMAALAVKANSALMKSDGDSKCGCQRPFTPVLNSGGCDRKSGRVVAIGGGDGGLRRGRSTRSSGGRRRGSRDFTAMLSAIPE